MQIPPLASQLSYCQYLDIFLVYLDSFLTEFVQLDMNKPTPSGRT